MLKLLVFTLLAVAGSVLGSEDKTVTEKATGRDVVNAVVDLIHQKCVFANDRLLLRRIALAETMDGTMSRTFERNGQPFNGGIWQITEVDFDLTKSKLTDSIKKDLKSKFGIDWSQVQYSDLLKPLYSGLAARMKIDNYFSKETIPQSLNDQAAYWADSYTFNGQSNRTLTINVFVTASNEFTTSCSSPEADIFFVLDSSGSIGTSDFNNVLLFTSAVVESFDISQENVRIGLIQFSNSAEIEFNLTTYDSKAAVQSAIKAVQFIGSGTNTAEALQLLTQLALDTGRQADGTPLISIVLTDGKSNDNAATVKAAEQLHQSLPEMNVFAVGVGSNVEDKELDEIASEPSCLNVFQLSSFADITFFTSQIMTAVCKAPAQLSPLKIFEGSVEKDQYYYFKVTVKQTEKGIKLKIKMKDGGVKVYFSWKVNNPSDALYDYTGTVADGKEISFTIPWADYLDIINANLRRKRSTDNVDGGENESTFVYGAIAGTEQKQNKFQLSYTDSYTDSSSTLAPTGGLLAGLMALYYITMMHQ